MPEPVGSRAFQEAAKTGFKPLRDWPTVRATGCTAINRLTKRSKPFNASSLQLRSPLRAGSGRPVGDAEVSKSPLAASLVDLPQL